ncbi:hypothetical protein E8E13_004260 [Curvularia kusanoi]|uniref:DNA/RNA-binding domain-containing protein n=1 Tax=Curvularia kusanoi TaxID=90978 RepID=A0A9P4W878_CURKU|nr:hypothetical protein E8E13_004260 [Curvularia kusanoi]
MSDIYAQQKRATSAGDNVMIVDPDYSRDIAYTMGPDQPHNKTQETRLYNPKQGNKSNASARRATKKRSVERSPDIAKPKQHPVTNSPQTTGPPRQAGLIELQQRDDRYPGLLLQPASRPISQEQLATEVKSIYSGLLMVEKKCALVDHQQAQLSDKELENKPGDHWQALIALHRTLLHEHHDFFLASQHPSASPALRRLAGKYTMPARMWKHGIHEFLELLRRGLPATLDFMLSYVYLAYQMVALLYETVPSFEDTWIECLGDLGRYRMAVEDKDHQNRETWAGVSRSWYFQSSDRNPTVGRLYHHLAILATPNALQQLYYFTTSLNCVEPFTNARESIKGLFQAVIPKLFKKFEQDEPVPPTYVPDQSVETNFVKSHALLFTRFARTGYESVRKDVFIGLDNHIGRVTAKWKEQGAHVAVSNITAWFDYGVDSNILRQLFLLRASQRRNATAQGQQQNAIASNNKPKPTEPSITEDDIKPAIDALSNDLAFVQARLLTYDTFALVLRRIGDKNVLPHVHVMLSFLSTLASISYVSHLVDQTPWAELVSFLNTLIKTETQRDDGLNVSALLSQPVFPGAEGSDERDELPLPEDHFVRGLIWAQEYIPPNWLGRESDIEKRYLELASTTKSRTERVLRLGYRLSTIGRWMSYDQTSHTFAVVMS